MWWPSYPNPSSLSDPMATRTSPNTIRIGRSMSPTLNRKAEEIYKRDADQQSIQARGEPSDC